MFTNVPETDYLILQQMSDYDLINYCQTSDYAQELCYIPNIRKRIINYKKYLDFNVLDHLNNLNPPYLLSKMQKFDYEYNDSDRYVLSYDFYIVKDNYTLINYIADDTEDYGTIQVHITHDDNFNLDDILEENTSWGLDIHTIYTIMVQEGLQKYAKEYLINYLDNARNLESKDGFAGFFEAMGLFYWFKINCMYLKLVNETIELVDEDFTLEYIQSQEAIDLKYRFINEIDLYYDLLINYIDTL